MARCLLHTVGARSPPGNHLHVLFQFWETQLLFIFNFAKKTQTSFMLSFVLGSASWRRLQVRLVFCFLLRNGQNKAPCKQGAGRNKTRRGAGPVPPLFPFLHLLGSDPIRPIFPRTLFSVGLKWHGVACFKILKSFGLPAPSCKPDHKLSSAVELMLVTFLRTPTCKQAPLKSVVVWECKNDKIEGQLVLSPVAP